LCHASHFLVVTDVRAPVGDLAPCNFQKLVAADAPGPEVVEQVGGVRPGVIGVEDDSFEPVFWP
jgi:hypothetical protein